MAHYAWTLRARGRQDIQKVTTLAEMQDMASRPPKGSDWAFEIKWDGYRLAIHVEPTQVSVLNRSGRDWTSRFSGIENAALLHLKLIS